MYTRCQRQRICLHSSNLASATQYLGQRYCPIWISDQFSNCRKRKRPPISAAFCTVHGVVFAVLLGGLLAWRVEGAGVMDLGDLVIAEAEHLAQDLVGVLAEQRRAGDIAR